MKKELFPNDLLNEVISVPTGALILSPSMGQLLTLIHGAIRIDVLQWLTTEGLHRATVGRRKIAQDIDNQAKSRKLATIGARPQAVHPSQKVVGIGEGVDISMKAMKDFEYVNENDIFSPLARERIGILKEAVESGLPNKWNGMTLDEWYHSQYEPKEISIYGGGIKGNYYIIDLEKARELMKRYGLQPFT